MVDTAETQLFLGREAMLFPESALDVDALMVEIRARECRSVGCWSLSADAALGTRLVGELSYHRSTPTRCRTIPLSCSLIGLARPLRRYCGSVASRTITDESQLRAVIGSPADAVVAKIADRLNDLTGQFIERSPFVCVATASPDGGLDVSPRGDPAGFVRILDERTLLIPDRPGNRIADTLTNLLVDPRIALLFLIPGWRHLPCERARGDHRRSRSSHSKLGGGAGAEARNPHHNRGGLHAMRKGVDPLRSLEPRAAHRPL